MAANAQNVVLGKGDKVAGTLLRGEANAADLPTDAKTPAPATFTDHGLIGSDGITLTIEKSTDVIRDMNGDAVRTITTEFATKIALPFLEVNEATLRATFGDDNVTITPDIDDPSDPLKSLITVAINADENPASSWVINLKDGTQRVRVVVGSGTAISSGDIKFVGTDAILLPLEINAQPDANGDYGLIYRQTA